jgi:cardiolipin synthase
VEGSHTFPRGLALASRRGPGNASVDLLDGGAEAYPRMLSAIARARQSVRLEVYAFSPSGVGDRFIEALESAAARGVAVYVVIDGWGSAVGGNAVANALRRAGCTVRIHNRLLSLLVGRFGRNHRKILLVDDEVAFVGGINIGDENLAGGAQVGWADIALEIRGPQCARLGRMMRRERQPPDPVSPRIFLSGLGGGWRLRRRYMEAFRKSKARIHVAHGYFLPDPGVVRALKSAARRGVQVHLLLAGQSDLPFVRAATRSLYRQLIAAGVRIHEWEGSILHAKLAAFDGSLLIAGSFNLDPLSLANLEVLVEVDDPDVVAEGEAWIEDHFLRSRAMTSLETSSFWHRWVSIPLGRLVSRVAEAIGHLIASRKLRQASRGRRRPW